MIKDGRNGSMPLGTSFLRKMRELPVIIRENISMHNICFQVNIEKPPLCCVTYIVIKWCRKKRPFWESLELLRDRHLQTPEYLGTERRFYFFFRYLRKALYPNQIITAIKIKRIRLISWTNSSIDIYTPPFFSIC